MAEESERRHARRFTMSLPIRVLPREPHSSELQAETRDISYQGLYFLTEARLQTDHEIEFVITLPRRASQTADVDIHCRGQIVRVESGPNGRVGVAAKIEHYEFMPVPTASAA